MEKLFTRKFFQFLFGFLVIIIATLLVVVGIQTLKSGSAQNAQSPPTATTTQ